LETSDIGKVCCVGVGLAEGLNKNVGDTSDIPTSHIDSIGQTTYPGDIA
jgi:hypothetical protein